MIQLFFSNIISHQKCKILNIIFKTVYSFYKLEIVQKSFLIQVKVILLTENFNIFFRALGKHLSPEHKEKFSF